MEAISLLGECIRLVSSVFDNSCLRVISTLTAGLLGFGTTLYTAIFLYFFFANAFFLVSKLFSLTAPRTLTISDTVTIAEISGSARQCSSQRWDCKPSTEEPAHNVLIPHRYNTDTVHVDPGSRLIRYALGLQCFPHAKKSTRRVLSWGAPSTTVRKARFPDREKLPDSGLPVG